MGKWQCTDDKCSSSCNYYGMSHVKTFDGLEYEFEAAPCTYDLVQVRMRETSHASNAYTVN
ncbi:hypothetical protein DPMN_161024 [Dreissena polymorpha]|uniref:VWFD domain-containing protein n=1 Tax=Dreissena polymorpha TaxID=45954 RepID=A0A9D4IPA4_DREPO|nr:hypothetical protein DPMN_161024 [Dreissena polymorpha]